ncbi:bifunctional 2-polyprenyl-6-hydroxyphenol methylase/3-demethylubiquinol 3-O-methyltransferase UbiG [Rhodopseudomonas sp. B29]|uniref:class I SAM-dependent methyltransferase n=1 Tax=Rhodopseudomonas sp. B29 TaxID=95607 RepID=UPI0003B2F104|nr:class I SAM-dependent methyltransferase [Rhodopseudomonas sp. B29]
MNDAVPGSQAYADNAAALIARYEGVVPAEVHGAILHLLPPKPTRVLDIGAGSGRDAAWLAAMGHQVVAVEPTAAFREAGRRLHVSPAITWVDDSLPALAALGVTELFGLVMVTAVWMHLDADERAAAMARVAGLVAPAGLLIMKIRHGPVPYGRRIFAVTAVETVAQAEANGLAIELQIEDQQSLQEANAVAGVTWTTLAFRAAR